MSRPHLHLVKPLPPEDFCHRCNAHPATRDGVLCDSCRQIAEATGKPKKEAR